jgi:hypothetical protein
MIGLAMPDKFKYLDEAIAATKSGVAAGEALQRILRDSATER